jgi:hypothetical protein
MGRGESPGSILRCLSTPAGRCPASIRTFEWSLMLLCTLGSVQPGVAISVPDYSPRRGPEPQSQSPGPAVTNRCLGMRRIDPERLSPESMSV